ncbi:uncharacterized protein [Dysidea avara]|uniref:uncharacterized protein isoform X2 n=1 Tax=Dysidea avara TaxID=196820 RepID=UPI00332524A9
MANWYQCVIILLVICCCFCNATTGSVNDCDQYKTHKWPKISNQLISTTLTECNDVCSQHCSWRYGQNQISNSSEVTLTSVSNDYGEYSCYKASELVRKVLVIPGNDNFTCSKCLSSSACVNGEKVTISFTVHIDECFIRIQECEVLQDGLHSVCTIGSGTCSLIFTPNNISEDYVVNCPILNTSYAIRSEKINLNGGLQPCTTGNITTSDTIVIFMTTLPSVTNTTNILPSTSNIVVNPSNTSSLDDESASSFRTVGIVVGMLLLLLLLLLIAFTVVIVLFCYFKSQRQPSGNNGAEHIIGLEENDNDNVVCSAACNDSEAGDSNEIPPSSYGQRSNRSEVMSKIRQAHPEIIQHINFITLKQYLNRYKIFTSHEMHHFNNNDSNEVSVNNLIEWLQRKDEEGVLNFVRALNDAKEHSGHATILRKLKVKVIQDIVYNEDMQDHT